MTRAELEAKFATLKRLGRVALVGLVAGALAFTVSAEMLQVLLALAAAGLILPLIGYLVVFTIWHWKGRYIGSHSNLWGALLLIETSGWFKVIYFFRHMLADLRQDGRYSPH